MSLWFAALLGLVQGITEFLPISSTAHLRILPALLGRPDAGAAFTAVIQLGSLAAVIAYFAKDILDMLRALAGDRQSSPARLAAAIVAGTVPIAVAGVVFKRLITGQLRSLYVVAGSLIVVAVIMWWADRRARQTRVLTDVTWLDGLLVGLGQACALVPGVSRSGATLTVALLLGLRRDAAARLSFLLSIPAIGAAGLFELKDAAHDLGAAGKAPLIVGTLVAAVTSYAAIAWLLRFLRTRTLAGFAIYRIALGGLLLGLLFAGTITG